MTAVTPHIPAPLSAIQRHMLLSEQLGRSQASHLVCMALRLDGVLDVDALRRALARIVARHEILRTGVRVVAGMPAAELRAASSFELAVESHATPGPGADDNLDAILAAETVSPLDLVGGLPIRARLLLGPGAGILIVTIHHLAFDEWSRRVFFAELAALYNAFRGGLDDPLPSPAVSYQDIVVLNEREVTVQGELLDYWRDHLTGLVPVELPADLPRPARRSGHGASVTCTVSRDDTERLAAIASAAGTTLATALFAACQVLLRQRAGRDDVTVGTTWAGREEAMAASVIGPLVNLVVLRGDTSGDPSFADLVARFGEVTLDAYEHSAAPFEWLVERLAGRRDLSRTPFFQILVEYVGQGTPPRLDGLAVTELRVPCTTSKYDLGFWFAAAPDGALILEVVWDTALYLRETVLELAGQLQRLLAFLAGHAATRLSEIPMPAAGRERAAAGSWPAPAVRHGAASAPDTPVEKELAAIWADVLDRPAPCADDDFFAIGGHSLLIVRVANRIRDHLDIDVPLSALFEHTVLGDLAAYIAHSQTAG